MANKRVERTDLRCEPSAIGGCRHNVIIETAVVPYIRFGAVLTKREVLALIECLGAGLREAEPGEQ